MILSLRKEAMMSEHDWTSVSLPDPDDPTEFEIHICRRCGLERHSEWGTAPEYLIGYLSFTDEPGCEPGNEREVVT